MIVMIILYCLINILPAGHSSTPQVKIDIEEKSELNIGCEKKETSSSLERNNKELICETATKDLFIVLKLKNKGLSSEERSIFKRINIIIEDYWSSNQLLVIIPSSNLDRLIKLPFVESYEPYKPEDKLDDTLFVLYNGYNMFGNWNQNNYKVRLSFFESKVGPDNFQEIMTEFNSLITEYEYVAPSQIIYYANLITIFELINYDLVKFIELESNYFICNDEGSKIISAPPLWNDIGLNGSGQIIGIFDTGLDYGVDNESMHKDFQGRIRKILKYHGTNPDDNNGHGTHVAGTIVGDGSQSGNKYQGIAYGAEFVFQAGGDDGGSTDVTPPSNLNKLFQDAYDYGARIHSDSWGSNQMGVYNSRSEDVDDYIWSHNNYTVITSAGNSGPFPYTITPPGTAKNAITVGATENYRPAKGTSADDIDDIYSSSSAGPTNDERIKPDVVAPGTWILSTRVNKSLVSIPSANFWGEYNDYYAYAGGTSMATAFVAGGTALLRQYFIEHENHEPSSALLKAAIINGAEDIGTRDIPNYDEGWGRVNISRSICHNSVNTIYKFVDNETGLNDNENFTVQYDVVDNLKPLKITLVWSDYKGSEAVDGGLINDLDLILENNKTGKYIGNGFENGWSKQNNTKVDTLNNVECIYIKTPPPGRYNITVAGSGIAVGKQKFALYVTGALSDESLLPPTGLKVTSAEAGSALNLSWWPNLRSDLSKYKIYRSNQTPDDFQLIGEVSQTTIPFYYDSNLLNHVTYYYKLKSVTYSGAESVFSDQISGIPTDILPPFINITTPATGSKIRNNISLEYTSDSDTEIVIFSYYLDLNSDAIPNDNNSWILIGTDTSVSDGYFWDTTGAGSGPGDAKSVILKAKATDFEGNNNSLLITNIEVDNSAPSKPLIFPVTPNPRNNPELTVWGLSEANATIQLFINNIQIAENKTNQTGIFNIEVYLIEGINNLTAKSVDEIGNGPGPSSDTVTVNLDTKPPVVDTGGPYVINIGTPFYLNASASYDIPIENPDYYITNYTWVVSKDVITYFFGKTPNVTLYEFGEYSVTLLLRDAAGNIGTGISKITIGDDIPPTVDAGGDRNINEDTWIFFNVFNSTDNDPNFFNNAIFRWTIINPYNNTFLAYGKNLTYIFYDLGIYTIILSAADAHNNTGFNTIYITVNDVTPPIANGGGNYTAVEYHPIYLNATRSTDNDPSFINTGKFEWRFKDNDKDVKLNGKVVSYTFRNLGLYEVTLEVYDRAGNLDIDYVYVEVIEDIEAPLIQNTYPADYDIEIPKDVTITCTFTEAIESLSVNDRNYYLTDSDGKKISGSLSYDPQSYTLSLTPVSVLQSNQFYHVYALDSIEDLAGNRLAANHTWLFYTVSPPLIVDMKPKPDSKNVEVTSKVIVIFNEQLHSTSVTSDALKVFDESGREMDGFVTYDNLTYSINYRPTQKFNYSTKYEVTLFNVIEDIQGNVLEQNHSWIFTTSAKTEDTDGLYSNPAFISSFIIIIIIIVVAVLIGTGVIKFKRKSKKEDEKEDGKKVEVKKPQEDIEIVSFFAEDSDYGKGTSQWPEDEIEEGLDDYFVTSKSDDEKDLGEKERFIEDKQQVDWQDNEKSDKIRKSSQLKKRKTKMKKIRKSLRKK